MRTKNAASNERSHNKPQQDRQHRTTNTTESFFSPFDFNMSFHLKVIVILRRKSGDQVMMFMTFFFAVVMIILV
jgi:hypothetical protein